MLKLRGTRFWVATAAVSAVGTLSILATAASWDNRELGALLPPVAYSVFILPVFFAALAASSIAMLGLVLEGVQETGEFPPLCLACYAAPWLCLALLLALV